MVTSHLSSARSLIGLLIERRRSLTIRMLAGASLDDLQQFKALQDAIAAAVQAHAAESEAVLDNPPAAWNVPDPRAQSYC